MASYRCAPNDVWSLGVILVNLSCGRNPWKQASIEDSTYKAFLKNPDFLKTILPVSDDLNDILCQIFQRNPESRITIAQLRQRIMSCQNFSTPAPVQHQHLTPFSSPQCCAVDDSDSDSYDSSPSDNGSTLSDAESLTDSCSTVSDSELDPEDSGYGSMCEAEPVDDLEPMQAEVERQASTAPFPSQAYVLPSHEYQRNPWNIPAKPNPWFQPWCQTFEHQYDQLQAVSHYIHALYPQPVLHSPYQHW